jgi:cholesterol transport system auxiliary component
MSGRARAMYRGGAGAGLATLGALVLCGCFSGLKSKAPPEQAYVLRAPQSAAPAETPAAPAARQGSLQVLRPLAAPGLASDRIAVLQDGHRLSYYRASRWAVALPDMVESLALERWRGGGAGAPLEGSRATFPAEYMLQLTIRRFEADYTQRSGAPIVEVVLSGVLVRRSDRAVLVTLEAAASAPAAEDRLSAVVGAFDEAAGAALDKLAERTASAIKTSTVPSPPSGGSASN